MAADVKLLEDYGIDVKAPLDHKERGSGWRMGDWVKGLICYGCQLICFLYFPWQVSKITRSMCAMPHLVICNFT